MAILEFITKDADGSAVKLITSGAVGTVFGWFGTTPPPHSLEMNGAEISRSVYHELFAVIGTSFGAGDGSTTYNLPDCRGEFPRGWDHGRGVDAGRALGSKQESEVKAHKHNIYGKGVGGECGNGSGIITMYGSNSCAIILDSAWWTKINLADAMDNYGGAETRPRNVAMMLCVVYE